ncbi:unnamed protein product [Vicia faba]|uniref:Malectin-like domain-containing protein n=1 Tax=Vicia faba TaxID=3906 RepID=A0AAV0Z1A1_VICFA|nr:unnamed protein product [Vicia faba]
MLRFLLLRMLLLCFASSLATAAQRGPFAMRISCGARQNVQTKPTTTLWYKDFGYTGGIPANASKTSWTIQDDQAFTEARVFLMDHTLSICFHSTGHGDPAILSIEILQIDNKAYYFEPNWSQEIILRTVKRLSCGFGQSKFGVDYGADPLGGDRFWQHFKTFGQDSDRPRSVETRIKEASHPPNFYPETLYRSALVSTSSQPDLSYILEVDSNKNYSVWLHFAEIDNSVSSKGQRVFDIMINGNVEFKNVDIVKWSGDRYTALVLNKTVTVSGRSLTITLSPKEGSLAIITAIEILEVILPESKTLSDEVMALQTLKKALGLPPRFGWNGDPCVPQQHPWTGVDCQLNKSRGNWVIDGLGLDNQGLKGFLPKDISRLHNLQIVNLSGNDVGGAIPSSLGTVTTLQVLDLSYNIFNGSIPESMGQLTSLKTLNLNGNFLSGMVPAALGARLLHRASFNFTDNSGLCGIPGLPTCGPHLSAGAKVGIGIGAFITFLFLITCSVCWWKRRQNIIRAQQIAARAAPYAKKRTHFSRDIQMTRHSNYGNAHTAVENGPILLGG